MTASTAPRPTSGATGRWRTWCWTGVALIAIALASASAFLTIPHPGGRMDPAATSADGAHALVALLRDHGVDVVVADTADDALRAARPDTLLLVAQTVLLTDESQLQTLTQAPGDLLLIQPSSRTREALAPGLRPSLTSGFGGHPDCDLREAQRAGTVDLDSPQSFTAISADMPLTRCYGGSLVRYRNGDDTVTVVGAADFMTNSGLLRQGNAALAMNLAGTHPRLVWYAPQHRESERARTATIFDLIPDRVGWIVGQLCLVVGLTALWKVRRLGPLVAEKLPVVVRASETVEGRGRLYRSRRARDRATAALRTATLQRLTPRLGLTAATTPTAIVSAAAAHGGGDPVRLQHILFGPLPATDDDLMHLAHTLDHIERQVTQS